MAKKGSMFDKARKTNNQTFVDKIINRRISAQRTDFLSPDMFEDETEADRIIRDYIKDKYLRLIINKSTARAVMNTLLFDPATGLTSDFKNLLGGVGIKGRADFITFLFETYAQPKIDFVNSSEVTLRSGMVRPGLRVNSRVYLISTGRGLQARSFKTGRIVNFKKHYVTDIVAD